MNNGQTKNIISKENEINLKLFQIALKESIIQLFKNIMPRSNQKTIYQTNYIDLEELSRLKRNEIQGNILRKMVSSIINIKCKKDIEIDGKTVNIDFGNELDDEVVEFITRFIAAKCKINIDKKDFEDNFELFSKLIISLNKDYENSNISNIDEIVEKENNSSHLDSTFYYKILNMDANQLLEGA